MWYFLRKINSANFVLAIGVAASLAAGSCGPKAYSQSSFNTEKNAKATASTEPNARATLFQEQNEEVEFCTDLDGSEDSRGEHSLDVNQTTGGSISHSPFGYFDVTSTSSQPTAIRPAALEKLRPLLETGQFQLLVCRMASARPSGLQAKPPGPKDGEKLQIADVRPATITVGETVYFGTKREKVGFPEREYYTEYNRDGAPVSRSSFVQRYTYVQGDRSVRGAVNIPGAETLYANLVDPHEPPIEEIRESCAAWVGDQQTLDSLAQQREVSRAKAEADAQAKAKQEADEREKAGTDALAKGKQEAEQKFASAEQDALTAGGWTSMEEYFSHATEFADYRTKLTQLDRDYKFDDARYNFKPKPPYRESPYFTPFRGHEWLLPPFSVALAAFNRANGTSITSRGGLTQLAASAMLTQVLAFAPEERSGARFLKLEQMAEAGPNTFDLNDAVHDAESKRNAKVEEALNSIPPPDPATGKFGDLAPDRNHLIADDFRWERCSHYYPTLWPKIQAALMDQIDKY